MGVMREDLVREDDGNGGCGGCGERGVETKGVVREVVEREFVGDCYCIPIGQLTLCACVEGWIYSIHVFPSQMSAM